jgi:rare lipoprotein A
MSLKYPLGICLLAGASSIALAAVVILLSTQAVHADARLSRPTAISSAAVPIVNATPSLLAPQITNPPTQPQTSPATVSSNLMKGRTDILHGLASWYGGVFNGRKTASGEPFDMNAMTACHPTLPFGTLVRVINRTNKRSVVVRITDRGDLVDEGRIIDLSYGAADKLAMTKKGLAKVDLQVISLGRTRGKG